MTVISCTQIAAGRSADGRSDRNRSYEVVWQVIVNDPYDGPATVGSHPTLPTRFAPYVGYENTNDPVALCTSLKPSQDGSEWQKWTVTATFETGFTNDDNKPEDDPEDDPAIRWLEIEFEKRKVTKEWDGTPIRNSAGQLIDGLERDDAVGIYCFERKERVINPYIKEYNNATNSDSFYDLAVREGLMRITVAKPEYRNGIQYYRHTYRVRVNPDKWDAIPADKGTLVKGADGKLTRPVDQYQQPIDGEIFLDGNGAKLPEGDPIFFLPAKKLYKPAPFSVLGL